MAITLSITGTSEIFQSSLPTLINNISVTAVDSADPTPNFVYSWYILSKPTGSSASLSGANTNSPDLTGVDTWGNYRLFVIVQNTDNGATTESDPLKAPATSFFTLKVKSTEASLTKPAAGERNWTEQYHDLIDVVEDLQGFINTGDFGVSVNDATASAGGKVELAETSEVLNGTSNGTDSPLCITPNVLVDALNDISEAQTALGRDLDQGFLQALQQTLKFVPLESIYDFSRQVTEDGGTALVNDDTIIYNSGTGYFEPIQHKLSTQKDVNLTSPANKSLLRYDTATSKWIDDSILTVLGRSTKYIPYQLQSDYLNTSPFVGDILAPVGSNQQCLCVYRNNTGEDLIIEGFDVNIGQAHATATFELCKITGADAPTRDAAMRANAWTRTGYTLTTTYNSTVGTSSGYTTFSKFTLADGEYLGIIANAINVQDRRLSFQVKAFWELTK
jgi:hypothetical protein